MTTAKDGAVMYWEYKRVAVPVGKELTIADATGAGDVFAASFFVNLSKGASPVAAVVTAHGVAGRSYRVIFKSEHGQKLYRLVKNVN